MATSVGQVLVFGTGTFLAYKNSGKDGSSLLFYSGAGFMLVSGRRIIRPRGVKHPVWGSDGAPWKEGMEGFMDQWNDFSKRGFFGEIEAVAKQSASLPKLKFDVLNGRAIREGRGARNALKRAIEEKEQIQKERAAGKLEPPTLEEVAKKRGARKAMEKEMKRKWKEAMAVDDSVKNLYKQAKRAVGKEGEEEAQADKDKAAEGDTQAEGKGDEEAKKAQAEEEEEKVDKLRSKMEAKMKAKRRKELPLAREIDSWDLGEGEKVTYVFDFPPKQTPSAGKGPNPLDRFQYVAESIGSLARPQDEVVLRVTSPGGEAALYGYLGCILKEQFPQGGGPKLTVAIDRIGASGGYLMAAPGHSIIAAPTAYVGSIGVYMAMPNLHKKLAKNEIEWLEFTAGEHKCPISTFGELKEAGKKHTELRLKSVHDVFKQFVKGCRPDIDIEKVANGDVWQGEEAKVLGLIDDVMTSNQLIRTHMQDGRWVVEVSYSPQEALVHQLFSAVGQGVATGVEAGLPASLSTAILPHLHRLTGGASDALSPASLNDPQGPQFRMSESEILNKMQS